MVDLADISGLEIFLAVVALLVAICCIIWAVRCAMGRREAEPREPTDDADGKSQGLLNKDEVVIDVPLPDGGGGETKTEARSDVDVAVCPICKWRLEDLGGEECRRLRPCGHVYHAECIGLWLQRGTTCPVCRATVVVGPSSARWREAVSGALDVDTGAV